MAWRFLATRLTGKGSEYIIDPDLPLASVKITHAISDRGGLDAQITPEVSRLIGSDGLPVFTPWSTAIYAEKDGVIRAGGIVESVSESSPHLEVQCVGFVGYLDGMPFSDVYTGYRLDPIAIGKMIWNHVQTQDQGNLGFIIDSNTSPMRVGKRGHPALRGRPVIYDEQGGVALTALPPQAAEQDDPYVLAWYQTSDLLSEFNKLAEAGGFDYLEHHYWVDADRTEIGHTLELKYPRIGRKRDDLRFVIGENVFARPKLTEDGIMFASEVWSMGSGEGSAMVHSMSSDHSQGRLRRVFVNSVKDVSDPQVITTLTQNELKFRSGQVSFDEIEVINTRFASYGDVSHGDQIFVQVGGGWYGAVNEWVRVIEISISPHENENMTMQVAREAMN